MDELKIAIDKEMERFHTKQLIYSHVLQIDKETEELIQMVFRWGNIQGLNGVKLWDLELDSPSKDDRKNVTCKAIDILSLIRTSKS